MIIYDVILLKAGTKIEVLLNGSNVTQHIPFLKETVRLPRDAKITLTAIIEYR